MPKLIRLATRGSALALAQTEMAAAALRAVDPSVEVEVVEVEVTSFPSFTISM